ncbi:MAG TPA: type IV toxin-antitoxin system AbiEi family antitoxin domain-containing protein [Deltaproteobacteria bacterium]|nr:type IV toxin-antitoxin system AbiEi family antitoxin domain-containing protein [Deltaproteobacteria bacterium]HOI06033.1 type IV toxin-antitoxin system AbiEi family antitoxin domain-containing protein [Deltaproteobacteria bacterium]
MKKNKPPKMSQVYRRWPKGTVATLVWLNELGVSTRLAGWHVRSGWLESFGPRAFVQPGDKVDWQGGLYALQAQLGMSVHAGGKTALELQGLSHYVPLGERRRVILISDHAEQLPAWFRKKEWGVLIDHVRASLFRKIPAEAVVQYNSGGFEIAISSAERAVMEQMHLIENNDDIEYAYQLMEGLNTLRPDVVQELLENCSSVRVKRFFLWSAETIGHDWFKRLDISKVDLGKGKRQIYRGGLLNHRYQITVPKQGELPGV